MERLATYSLDITPGQAAADTSCCQSGHRASRGPSFPGRVPFKQHGPSLCPAKAPVAFLGRVQNENIPGRREYCRVGAGISIPGCLVAVSGGAFPLRTGRIARGKKQRLKCCPRGVQLNIMAGFPALYMRKRFAYNGADRAKQLGFAPAVDSVPQAWVLHSTCLNGKARSVTCPFFTLGCRD